VYASARRTNTREHKPSATAHRAPPTAPRAHRSSSCCCCRHSCRRCRHAPTAAANAPPPRTHLPPITGCPLADFRDTFNFLDLLLLLLLFALLLVRGLASLTLPPPASLTLSPPSPASSSVATPLHHEPVVAHAAAAPAAGSVLAYGWVSTMVEPIVDMQLPTQALLSLVCWLRIIQVRSQPPNHLPRIIASPTPCPPPWVHHHTPRAGCFACRCSSSSPRRDLCC
jgi:hypothetical protein